MRIFEIPVIGDPLYIDHISEIPVLKNTNIEITVKTEPQISPIDSYRVPMPGCTVDMEYADGSINRGITDIDGKVIFENENIDNTKILSLTYYKGGCLTNYSNIEPYMWSYSENATGPNNGNNIIRDPDTDYLYMTYSLYDPYAEPNIPRTKRRIITAYSENEGNWWQLSDLGYGMNPTIDKFSNLSPDIFYDQIVGYYYESVGLPNPAAVTNGSVHVEPGSMMSGNIDTTHLQTTGISYADNYTMELTHMLIERDNPDNTIVTPLINYLGLYAYNDPEYLVIPGHNPTIALEFNYSSELNDRIIAFEDKNSEICQIRYNSFDFDWDLPERKSFSENIKSINPHIDGYGDCISLVWQEETGEGTDEYRIYLNDSRFIGDNTETDKRYPKIKRGNYISCVEEKTNVNLYYYVPDGEGKELNIYTTNEEVYYPDFDIKTRLSGANTIEHTIYCMFTEKDGNIYRIKTNRSYFYTDEEVAGDRQPIYRVVLLDTMDVTGDSPLYEYINSETRPVERISSVIKGLNGSKYYEILVKTANNNKNEPYILMIDGEVQEVIYGKENELLIPINGDYTTDREITIAVDMTKGNPHRTVDINVYEYDEVELTETIGTANTMLTPFKPSKKTTPFSVINKGIQIGNYQLEVNVPNNTVVKIGIYDIIGREVNSMTKDLIKGKNKLNIKKRDKHNNELSKGVYFIRIETENNNYTGKLINLK